MEKQWLIYWILAAIAAAGEIGFVIWSLFQPSGQAMPAMILPMIAGVIAVVAFAIVAVIIALVEAWLG